MPKLCTIDGCERKFLARGLCSMHYNAAHRKPNPVAEFQCAECGTTFTKERARANRYKNLYCSLLCRDNHRHREVRLSRSQVQVYKPRPLWHTAHHAYRPAPEPRAFVSGSCRKCSAQFVDRQVSAVFCSALCARRWHRDERKARMGYAVPKATRTFVYQRDNGVCQLCNERVDMTLPPGNHYAPTVDHIIPVSWTLIPNHEAQNLRLAHMICNARRGDARSELATAA